MSTERNVWVFSEFTSCTERNVWVFSEFTSCTEGNVWLLWVHLLYRAKCMCLLWVHFCTERNVCVFCVFTSCTAKYTSSVCSLPVQSVIYVSSVCSLPVRSEMCVSYVCSLPVQSAMCLLNVHFLYIAKCMCLLIVHFLYVPKGSRIATQAWLADTPTFSVEVSRLVILYNIKEPKRTDWKLSKYRLIIILSVVSTSTSCVKNRGRLNVAETCCVNEYLIFHVLVMLEWTFLIYIIYTYYV